MSATRAIPGGSNARRTDRRSHHAPCAPLAAFAGRLYSLSGPARLV